MRYLGFGLLAASACLSSASAQNEPVRQLHAIPDLSESQFKKALRAIDEKAPELLEAFHVPGVSIAIVKDDRVVWLKGYGYRNLEKKLPFTPDTITTIASCSKAFTSTLALMAVQDGKLNLDDPVRKYLPYFHLKDPLADAKITVADLMCHSSGLPRTDQAWSTEMLDAEECVKLLSKCEPTFEFRENAQYSNVLVNAASMVTSAAYAQPWPQVLREKITGPLGMDSTSPEVVARIDASRMAVGYWFNPLSGAIERERYDDAQNILGAGAIKSTARDLAKWVRFHLGEGTFEGKKILDSSILAEAYRPRQETADDDWFGLGWVHDNRWPVPVISHGGSLDGFRSNVCLVPSKHLGVVILDNADDQGMGSALLRSILEKFVGKRDMKYDGQPAKEVGIYVDPTATHLLRTYYDGSLWAVLDQGKAIRLKRNSWRTYVTADSRNPRLQLTFTDDRGVKGQTEVTLVAANSTTVYRHRVQFDAGISVEALMAKSVAAYGGEKALSMPPNITGRYEAVLHQEGLRALGLLVRAGNDLGYMERLYDGDRYLATTLSGVSSDGGGSTQTNYLAIPLVGSDLVDARIDAQICQAYKWKETFSKVEIIARQSLGYESVFVVRKQPKRSPNQVVDFISQRTGLVIRREVGNPASVTEFTGFKSVNGVILPYRFTTIDAGLHREDIQILQFERGARNPHWAFHPLSSAITP